VKELSREEPEIALQAKEELSKGRGEAATVDFNRLEIDLGGMNHQQ
jgi:hypothetical protein